MPYKTNAELPDSVKSHLPSHAQDISAHSGAALAAFTGPPEAEEPSRSTEEVRSHGAPRLTPEGRTSPAHPQAPCSPAERRRIR